MKMAMWKPKDKIDTYPSVGDGKILITINNEKGTRSISMLMTTGEAEDFGSSIINAVTDCLEIRRKRDLMDDVDSGRDKKTVVRQ